ncbi:MAG: ROK family protein [Gemmatimonadota bacterium]|nr:MAG: ROK family protein [Gemmatimonadota bacterium]
MRYIVGVDIGGTNLVVGTVPEDGSALFGYQTMPTDVAGGPDGVVGQIERLVTDSLAEARSELGSDIEVVGIGIGAPGPIDRHTGTVFLTPNLGWTDMPLRDRVSAALGLPATLDNDANCAILGEWWRGAAQGGKVVVGLTIGTGIGGAVVLDGKIFHGASGVAGEFGHASIDQSGRKCNCGNYGCVEAYSSGPAIARRAVEGIEAGAESALPQYVDGELDRITAKTVSQAAADGDKYCLEVITETAHVLGLAIANMVNILNPDIVVICGGVTAAGDHLFDPMRNQVRRRAFRPGVAVCRIVPGSLTGTAGVYGAVASFKEQTWGSC